MSNNTGLGGNKEKKEIKSTGIGCMQKEPCEYRVANSVEEFCTYQFYCLAQISEPKKINSR